MSTARLSKRMEKRIAALCKKTGKTKDFYVRQALEEHIGDLEDLYITEARLADIDSGIVEPLTLEEAFQRCK